MISRRLRSRRCTRGITRPRALELLLAGLHTEVFQLDPACFMNSQTGITNSLMPGNKGRVRVDLVYRARCWVTWMQTREREASFRAEIRDVFNAGTTYPSRSSSCPIFSLRLYIEPRPRLFSRPQEERSVTRARA